MARVRVHLVSWNGARYVPFLFASLRAQTFRDFELRVLDNGSSDGMVEAMEAELRRDFPVAHRLIRETRNTGFAPAHNRLIRDALKGDPDCILLLNQDMYLEPNYLESVVACMDAHPDAGAATGLLLRWNFPSQARTDAERTQTDAEISHSGILKNVRMSEFMQQTKTEVIDSAGLAVRRTRQVVERRGGERLGVTLSDPEHSEGESKGLPSGRQKRDPSTSLRPVVEQSFTTGLRFAQDDSIEVFGVSGALPMYRTAAIKSIMYKGEFFDEDFFSYKEDVDAAFRLRSAGWKACLVPSARAYHDRSAAGAADGNWRSVIRNRKAKSSIANYYSYRNHLLTLIKNERFGMFFRDAPFILWYELKKAIYLLLFEPRILIRGWRDIIRLLPRMFKKRRSIMRSRSHRPDYGNP